MRHANKDITGKVLWINSTRHYGLVLPEHGKPKLMHIDYSDSREFSSLVKGQPIRFDVIQTRKGEQAGNVMKQ